MKCKICNSRLSYGRLENTTIINNEKRETCHGVLICKKCGAMYANLNTLFKNVK